jgi:uncharacterized protein YkwD
MGLRARTGLGRFSLLLGLVLIGGGGLPLGAQPSPPPPSSAAAPPDTVNDPRPAYDLRSLERAIHRHVNAVRERYKRSPVTWADSLHTLARAHSRDMANRDFFAHTNPSGEDVQARARRQGRTCRRSLEDGAHRIGFAENLYRGTLYNRIETVRRGDTVVERIIDWKTETDLARRVVQGWLKSPGHRRNLLSPTVALESIGIALTPRNLFVTQVLC